MEEEIKELLKNNIDEKEINKKIKNIIDLIFGLYEEGFNQGFLIKTETLKIQEKYENEEEI